MYSFIEKKPSSFKKKKRDTKLNSTWHQTWCGALKVKDEAIISASEKRKMAQEKTRNKLWLELL